MDYDLIVSQLAPNVLIEEAARVLSYVKAHDGASVTEIRLGCGSRHCAQRWMTFAWDRLVRVADALANNGWLARRETVSGIGWHITDAGTALEGRLITLIHGLGLKP